METTMHVLVYGATGTQGGPVARRLLGRGDRVRVLTRDPDPARAIAAAGAEIAQGDLSDGSGLRAAHEGVDAVFMQITATARPDQLPLLTRAGAEAVRAAGVGHVVMTTSSVVPPALTGVAAPDARVAMLEAVRSILPGAVVLRPTLLLDNFSGPLRPALDSGVIPQGIPADVPVAYLSADDQAAFAVAALDRPALAGELIPIAGPDAVTGPTLAAVLSAAVGHPLQYVPMDEPQTREALAFAGEDVARAVAQMYAWEGTAGADQLAPDIRGARELLGFAPTPLAVWARQALAPAEAAA
jgi:uncharacterized protein YbjT (DUF2867 family)